MCGATKKKGRNCSINMTPKKRNNWKEERGHPLLSTIEKNWGGGGKYVYFRGRGRRKKGGET